MVYDWRDWSTADHARLASSGSEDGWLMLRLLLEFNLSLAA